MFIITFLAEWGDRSQITAIALSASNNIWGVAIGGSLVSYTNLFVVMGVNSINF